MYENVFEGHSPKLVNIYVSNGNETTQQTTIQQRPLDNNYLTNEYSTKRQFDNTSSLTNDNSTNSTSTKEKSILGWVRLGLVKYVGLHGWFIYMDL